MYNKENIKQEALKSIRYIIPIVFVFIGILALDNYSSISNSIINNISTIKGILAPLFIGFIIAYILNQPMKFLEKKFNLKRGLSVAIIYVTLALVLILSLVYLVPNIKSSIQELVTYIPQSLNQIEDIVNSITSQLNMNINISELNLHINEFITKVVLPFLIVV